MKIDKLMDRIPSRAINKITGGRKHSSMCARIYLYRLYVSKKNPLINLLVFVIDGIESGHCRSAAIHWKIAHRKHNCYFPERYNQWLVNSKLMEAGNE
jgi:hypothetical protein